MIYIKSIVGMCQRRRISLPYRGQLAERIAHLSAAFSEVHDGRILSPQSLAGLIDFLESNPSSGYPDLTATPAGDAYAEWRGPRDGF